MSISYLKFADHACYTQRGGTEFGGGIYYFRTGVTWAQTDDSISFSLHETAEPTDVQLIEYADGTKLIMSYTLTIEDVYPDSFQYNLSVSPRLVGPDGSTLVPALPAEGAHELFSYTQPGFNTVPFSEMYYVPSIVEYRSGDTPAGGSTGPGQEAVTLYLWGAIYWKKPRVPVGGYIPLLGDQNGDELANSYGAIRFSEFIIDDGGYDDYFGDVDPNDEWHKTGTTPPKPNPSEPGGGDKPTDDEGQPVDFPDLPITSVINTGFITLYNPDATQLRSLATVLWGNNFEQSIRKILNDPFDGIIGFSMVPFTPTVNGSIPCVIGNFDSNVTMPLVSAQYYTLDCGTLTVSENWKNALDYNATEIEIFVPFVGFRTLNIQDCMGKVLQLKYNVDIFTGAGIAILKCGNKCLYEWPCNLAYNIPLTGSNKAALYTGLINIALSGATGAAAGGVMGAVGGAANSALNVVSHGASQIERSGAIVSNTGILGEFTPYIVIHRPNQSLAQNFKSYKGYQSNMTVTLGSCSGYTEVEFVHLTGINGATDTELEEIEELLKRGVII